MTKAIRRAALLFAFSLLILASTVGVAGSQAGDGKYDADGDRLIEVSNLEHLDAIRHDLDGDGSPDMGGDATKYGDAFPISGTEKVCESSCNGYELTRSLDFDDSGSYASGAVNTAWTTGNGWGPIGDSVDRFGAEFDGNGHSISNLYINRPDTDRVGLFATTDDSGLIRRMGLTNIGVAGKVFVGGLVGRNRETVIASHASGNVSGDAIVGGLVGGSTGTSTVRDSYAAVTVSAAQYSAGGLVGSNGGTIISSYATGNVTSISQVDGLTGISSDSNTATTISSYATGNVKGDRQVGGLLGRHGGTAGTGFIGAIISSYATGSVSGNSSSVGGLIGTNVRESMVTASYWDTQTSGQTAGVGEGGSTGVRAQTTAQLKSPIGYTGIYSTWDADLDNADGDDNSATETDDFWDFGTSSQYPALKADLDGDGSLTWQEFGIQRGDGPAPTPPGAPTGLKARVVSGEARVNLSWTAPANAGGALITGYKIEASDDGNTSWTEVYTTTGDATRYTDEGDDGDGPMFGVGEARHYRVSAMNSVGPGALSNVAKAEDLVGRYDANNNRMIDKAEVITAINDYLFGEVISKVDMIRLINLYLFGPSTQHNRPGAPEGLTAAGNGQTRIDLSWTAPTDDGGADITGYRIEVSTSGSSWSDLEANTRSTGTSYSHTGLSASSTRHYRVSAINSAGTGPASDTNSATTDAAMKPGEPTGLTATADGQTEIDLSWDAPSADGGADITGYKIEVSTNGSSWSDLEANTRSTSTSYSHSSLTAGSTRHYRVSAINSVGTGPASNLAAAKTSTTGTDREALIALYNATDGPNWANDTNWLTDEPLGAWHGVSTDASGRVTRLWLDWNGLSGSIPSEMGNLTSLEELSLSGNSITDISGVSEVISLRVLRLDYSNIPDISPVAGLTNLTELSFSDTDIPDLSVLSGLSNLEKLRLIATNTTDLSPLSGLTNLMELTLSHNSVTDIFPLAELTNLTYLNFWENQIEDISALSGLTNLTGVGMGLNSVTDISAISGLTKLETLSLNDNSITEISSLAGLTNLMELYLGTNSITDVSALAGLTSLMELDLASNNIADIAPLAGLTNLRNLDVRGNVLNDSSIAEYVPALESNGTVVLFDRRLSKGDFDIELVLLDDFTESQKRVIEYTAQRWMAVIIEDVPEYEFTGVWSGQCGGQSFEIPSGERIDDLRIYVATGGQSPDIHGTGGIYVMREESHLPVVGCMAFDLSHANLLVTGLHEIGHVLGFASEVWNELGFYQNPPNGDEHFNGPSAIAAFDAAGGSDYDGAKVPLVRGESHWRLSILEGELMSPSGGGTLSAITVQSMADLGYGVDVTQADAYSLPLANGGQ